MQVCLYAQTGSNTDNVSPSDSGLVASNLHNIRDGAPYLEVSIN